MDTFEEGEKLIESRGFRPETHFLSGCMVRAWFGDTLVDPSCVDENGTYVFIGVGSLAKIRDLLKSLVGIQTVGQN
jgi:hypothetical protein